MEPVFAAHKGVQGLGPLYTPWDEVIETSDIITCHAPLTPGTRHMISTPEFEAMRQQPLLINTSRGGLVDEAALVDALDRSLIAGVGFDVLTKEPPAPDNPLLKILNHPNVIVTPHVAWASEEAMSEVWRQTIEAVDKFIEDSPVRLLT
jgi:glycerate dehydrogenase